MKITLKYRTGVLLIIESNHLRSTIPDSAIRNRAGCASVWLIIRAFLMLVVVDVTGDRQTGVHRSFAEQFGIAGGEVCTGSVVPLCLHVISN